MARPGGLPRSDRRLGVAVASPPVPHGLPDLTGSSSNGATILAVAPLPLAAELREVHRSALGPGALSDEWAAERLPRHAEREGFVFLVARAEDGSISGFAYGYDGARGHWWSEQVARALTAAQRDEWLDRPHYEVAELHVLPGAQRR